MIKTPEIQQQDDLRYMPQKEVAKMKLRFKAGVDNHLKKVVTDKMNESHINALRKYITVQMMNREKFSAKQLAKISKLSEIKIRKITHEDAEPLFGMPQRQKTKEVSKKRYIKYGHGLLGTGQRRLYFPLIRKNEKSKTENSIESYLNKKGYFIRDYVRGYATDMEGKQEYKIGKLIKEDETLSKSFMTDDTRVVDQQCLVLSDYANDIAYMSTRRGWESCMSHDGLFRERPPSDIEHGTIIGYLVNKKDPYIYDPLARVLFKPLYNSEGDVSYHVNKCYGLHHDTFKETAEQIAQQISSKENGIYKLPKDVYADNSVAQKIILEKNMGAEEFLDFLDAKYVKLSSGEIIVNGDLDMSNLGLEKLPDLTRITVMGNFNCSYNSLESLIGVPQKVFGDFNCHDMALKSLEGAPKDISGCFDCSSNALTSLSGVPQDIGGYFSCSYNKLTSLVGLPDKIRGGINCNNNKLTSLLGAPLKVKGFFNCEYNHLSDLTGAPQEIDGYFQCNSNGLKSLSGAPQKVSGRFDCGYNKLMDLMGAPQEVGGAFNCGNNELKSLSGGLEKVGRFFNCSNNKLTDLIGAPSEVAESFDCGFNLLTSLEGSPQKVRGSFYCSNNKLTDLIGAPQEVSDRFDCLYNELKSLKGLPKNFEALHSDFGFHLYYTDIPKRYLKESRSRDFFRKAKQALSF